MSMFINFGYCAVCFNGSLSDGRYMNDDKKVEEGIKLIMDDCLKNGN